MKRSRSKVFVLSLGILIVCFGLAIIVVLYYFGKINTPFLTATVEHTFEAGEITDWDTGIGLRISLPPLPTSGKMQFTVKRSAPESQPEGGFIAIRSVYDIMIASENIQEDPLITYSFEIPWGIEKEAAVILHETDNGWELAENVGGTPGGEISPDGRYITITKHGGTKEAVATWLYQHIFFVLDKLPQPPPPDPIIEVKQPKLSTEDFCSGCLISDVTLKSPVYKIPGKLGKHIPGIGGTWYYIQVNVDPKDITILGPQLPGFSPYLEPGETQELRILFPSTGGTAHICLNTDKAFDYALFSWADRLGVPWEELKETLLLGKVIERFQGRVATLKDIFWVVWELLKKLVWEVLGTKIQLYANVAPVSIDIAVYINGWMNFPPETCVDVVASASPQGTTPPQESLTYRIAFVSDRDGNQEIYVMNADGSGVTNLTNNPSDDYSPTWSPDGRRIAFLSERDGNPEIYVVNADGSGTTNLTNNPSDDYSPTWSPDGRRIAFLSRRRDCTEGGSVDEIYVVNADGSNVTRLHQGNCIEDIDFAWSPDGKRIVFSQFDYGRTDRKDTTGNYMINSDGSGETPLSESPLSCQGFTWSPDSKRIAFMNCHYASDAPFGQWYIMNSDGSEVTLIPMPGKCGIVDGGGSGYGWLSPDWTHIAYLASTGERCSDVIIMDAEVRQCPCNGIFVMNADGSGVTNLTNNPSSDYYSPAWSPDGMQITFVSVSDGNDEIYVINADGSNHKNLTNNPASDRSPVWSPVPLPYLNVPESEVESTNTPPSPAVCPAEGKPKFKVGQEVITTDALMVRINPGKASPEVKPQPQPKGASGKILEGPACADNYVWWKVEYQSGTIGWSAENWLEVKEVIAEVSAGNNVWTSIGPEGGSINALAFDPQNPNTVYAGTWGGVFKTTDGGVNWVNTGLTSTWINALAIDPQNPNTLYAGIGTPVEGGIFKTTDGGVNWTAVGSGLTTIWINALAIDPGNPNTVYAGTWGGSVFKTTDGGGNWTAVNTDLTNTFISGLAIDPRNPNTVYAGTWGGVFKTTNGGGNWTAVNTGLTNTHIEALAIDPGNPNTVYAGTDYGGVFKTTDGGGNWTAVNAGLTNTKIRALAIDLQNPNTVYAGTLGGGVFVISFSR